MDDKAYEAVVELGAKIIKGENCPENCNKSIEEVGNCDLCRARMFLSLKTKDCRVGVIRRKAELPKISDPCKGCSQGVKGANHRLCSHWQKSKCKFQPYAPVLLECLYKNQAQQDMLSANYVQEVKPETA